MAREASQITPPSGLRVNRKSAVPVHVQLQIQCPATGEIAGLTLVSAAAPGCVDAIHDQIHELDSVGASAAVGSVPSDQSQLQTQGSLPLGTVTFEPGSTTLRLMSLSPVEVALADTP